MGRTRHPSPFFEWYGLGRIIGRLWLRCGIWYVRSAEDSVPSVGSYLASPCPVVTGSVGYDTNIDLGCLSWSGFCHEKPLCRDVGITFACSFSPELDGCDAVGHSDWTCSWQQPRCRNFEESEQAGRSLRSRHDPETDALEVLRWKCAVASCG
jgi:hypothetical protein